MNPDFFTNGNTVYTPTEQRMIDSICQNYTDFSYLTIGQLAAQLGVSEATVSRFVRHAGYSDFKEMRAALLAAHASETPAGKLSQTLQETKSGSVADIFTRQQQYLQKTLLYLDDAQMEAAVSAVLGAKNVYLYGKGASAGLAQIFAFRLNRFGIAVHLLPSGGSEIFEQLVNITADDLVIVFGFQKTPREAAVLLNHKKEAGYGTILITSRLYQEENLPADIRLFVYRGENQEYHSMTTAMTLVDALVLLTAQRMESASFEKLSRLYRLKEKYRHDIPR